MKAELNPALRSWLIAQGFPSDGIDGAIDRQTTPLMRACQLGDTAMVEALLQAGADLAPVNADGNNALWLACFSEVLPIIDRLIEAGIALDHQNPSGSTCLMYAASSGKAGVVARLLSAGADTALQNQDDFTALDLAASLECLNRLRAKTRQPA
ncbi:MAG: ankyrin repeat domain-containing protein [Methylococcaceae bacterium]|nr:ankyrin repeat domain-containing protein [Methylococcaceae bacterium]